MAVYPYTQVKCYQGLMARKSFNPPIDIKLLLDQVIIQMIQKKKGLLPSTKKLNRIKSEEYMPIGSLIQQIGELKQELKGIKKGKKKQSPSCNNSRPQNHQQNKENSLKGQFNHQICSAFPREIRLKVQIIWGRVCRGLDSNDSLKVKSQILELIELFNSEISEYVLSTQILKRQFQEAEITRQAQRKQESDKHWAIAENNKRLQNQAEELKANIFSVAQQKEQKLQEYLLEYDEQKEVIDDLKAEVQQLTKNNMELEALIEQWELQSKNLQQKCIALQKNINGKDHQIKMLEDDVRYLRLQSQKFKAQKKQFQKLWQKSSVDLREFKRAFEEEVVKAQREKNKWMNECELRRHESEQIQGLQSQKEILMKEVQDLRNKYSLKCKEISETKALLHEVQRKLISTEGQNFRMSNELDKSQRQNSYWQKQIAKLRTQFQEYSQVQLRHPKTNESQKKTKTEKLRALDDIHSLIRQFRCDDAAQK